MLQRSLVKYHGIGLGPNFSEAEGKAIVLVRLNSHPKGFSAIRMELAVLMRDLINRNIIPVIPKLGSVGASGDLTPLSYLAAVLMGERKVYYQGKIIKAKTAFKKENLKPIPLKAKEGLAMMNGTSVMTALASLAWFSTYRLACISDFLTAATVEVLNGNDIPFRSKIAEVKNHYSLRCAPQINGVLRDTLNFTKTWSNLSSILNSFNGHSLGYGSDRFRRFQSFHEKGIFRSQNLLFFC